MKFDLHCHSLAIKKSEKNTRTIPDNNESYEKFLQVRIEKNVNVIAITNHNHFDLIQFNKIKQAKIQINDDILILPGAELDILDSNGKSHNSNIILDESYSQDFFNYINSAVQNPENFKLALEEFVTIGKRWKAILLIDCRTKDFDFPDSDYEYIKQESENGKNFIYLLESSNDKSAAIVSNHDRKSIAGSDSLYWDSFDEKKLPSSEYKINSFIDLYNHISNTYFHGIINKTGDIDLDIIPMDEQNQKWEKNIKLSLKTGINLIVGPKASGKTVLLNSIKNEIYKFYPSEIEYYGEKSKFDDLQNKLIEELMSSNLNIDSEFQNLVSSLKACNKITALSLKNNYNNLISFTEIESHKKYSLIQKMTDGKYFWDDNENRKFRQNINTIIDDIANIDSISIKLKEKYELSSELYDNFNEAGKLIVRELFNKLHKQYAKKIKIKLIISTKNKLKQLISIKTNSLLKPSALGLYNFWKNRSDLKNKIEEIINIKEQKAPAILVGDVIDSNNKKNKIFINSISFIITKESIKKYENYNTLSNKKNNKTQTLKFVKLLLNISKEYLKLNIISSINNIVDMVDKEIIKSGDLVGYSTYYTRNDSTNIKVPSSGEKNFLVLSNALNNNNSTFYFIDEPEKSLDNKLVYDYIVEKLRILSSQKKFIILSSHNANIAVLSNPKTILYREVGDEFKKTYIGNSIDGIITDIEDDINIKDWRSLCLELLEGGEEAFSLRKEYYGTKK